MSLSSTELRINGGDCRWNFLPHVENLYPVIYFWGFFFFFKLQKKKKKHTQNLSPVSCDK